MWMFFSTLKTWTKSRTRLAGATLVASLALLALMAGATPARALDPCLVCHANAGLGVQGRSSWVHTENYLDSVHGKLSCDDCHKGLKGFPHAVDNEVRCDLPCHVAGAGHGELAELEANSVHANSVGPAGPACLACHTGGGTLRGKEAAAMCRSCHPGLDPQRGLYPDSPGAFVQRAHLSVGADRVAPVCQDCHGTHGIEPAATARTACQQRGCHPGAGQDFGTLFDHGGKRRQSPWGGASMLVLLLGLLAGVILAAHALRG